MLKVFELQENILSGIMNHDLDSILRIERELEELKQTAEVDMLRNMIFTYKENTIPLQLLEKIRSVKKGFAFLEYLFEYRHGRVDLQELSDDFNIRYLSEQLKDTHLVEVFVRDKTYIQLTTRGKNIFKLYKSNKKYTNRYEQIKRLSE